MSFKSFLIHLFAYFLTWSLTIYFLFIDFYVLRYRNFDLWLDSTFFSCSNWVSVVEENSTLSAYLLYRVAISITASSHHWGWVSSANCFSFSLQFDVTTISPAASPWVSYDPVISMYWVRVISYNLLLKRFLLSNAWQLKNWGYKGQGWWIYE